MDTSGKIDWNSEESHLFLNPRLPDSEKNLLQNLARQFARPGHIWIASSGSSQTANQSLKLMALSKKAFLASSLAVNKHLESTSSDVWVQNLPRFHVGGLSIESRVFLSGARVVVQEGWKAEEFARLISREKATLSSLVPTQIFDLIQFRQKAPTSLRAIVVGGSALSEDLYQQALDLGWPLLPSFGMTECCSQIATAGLDGITRRNRQLHLLSHIQARVNVQDMLEIQSASLLTGFAQVINGENIWRDPKIDGWYCTQDLAELNEKVLIPKGRHSYFIKVKGEGVDLQKLQHQLEDLAREILPNEWQGFQLAAVDDDRDEHRIVLQHLTETDSSELTKRFNLKVAPFERIVETQAVENMPWKKRSPQSW
jgi:o-succinylbenzoate---CoA ligase